MIDLDDVCFGELFLNLVFEVLCIVFERMDILIVVSWVGFWYVMFEIVMVVV